MAIFMARRPFLAHFLAGFWAIIGPNFEIPLHNFYTASRLSQQTSIPNLSTIGLKLWILEHKEHPKIYTFDMSHDQVT